MGQEITEMDLEQILSVLFQIGQPEPNFVVLLPQAQENRFALPQKLYPCYNLKCVAGF